MPANMTVKSFLPFPTGSAIYKCISSSTYILLLSFITTPVLTHLIAKYTTGGIRSSK